MALIDDYCENCGSTKVESIKQAKGWKSVCNTCGKEAVICAVVNEKPVNV